MPPCHYHQIGIVSLQEPHKEEEEAIVGSLSATALSKVGMSPDLILTIATHVQGLGLNIVSNVSFKQHLHCMNSRCTVRIIM